MGCVVVVVSNFYVTVLQIYRAVSDHALRTGSAGHIDSFKRIDVSEFTNIKCPRKRWLPFLHELRARLQVMCKELIARIGSKIKQLSVREAAVFKQMFRNLRWFQTVCSLHKPSEVIKQSPVQCFDKCQISVLRDDFCVLVVRSSM